MPVPQQSAPPQYSHFIADDAPQSYQHFQADDHPEPEPSGVNAFVQNLIPHGMMHPEQDAEQEREHPIRSVIEGMPGVAPLESAFQGVKRSGGELGHAFHDLTSGNPAGAAVHGVNAIPFVGPAMVNAAEKPDVGGTGSYGGDLKSVWESPSAMGTLASGAAQAAPAVLGGMDAALPGRPLVGEVPTQAKGAALLDKAMQKARNEPVNLTRSGPILDRAMQLSDRSHGTITPLNSLLERSKEVTPMDYSEARDRSSAISNLTGNDKMSATNTLQGQAKLLNRAFSEDIGDAADRVGAGDDYRKGMRVYRQGSQLKDIGNNLKKVAVPAAVTGAAGATGYKLMKALER